MQHIKNINEKGITLIALVITIIVLILLSGVVITIAIREEGVLSNSKEASFRQEMAQVREIVNMSLINERIDEVTERASSTAMIPVPMQKAEKWNITLKKELIYWGNYNIEINELTENYVKENFTNIIREDENGNISNIFYIEDDKIEDKKYLYNKETDIVYKIKATKIGKYKVHSVEELDTLKSGGEREKNYKKIEYDVEYRTIGSKSYYEPDLNGLNENTTSLIFYKVIEDAPALEEYKMESAEWLEKGRPNEITIEEEKYILYDYEKKIWGNIRIINSTIETNWVWIPRYSFKNTVINNVPNTEIEFLKIEDSVLEDYQIAGAFEENNLKGIWTSKYETTSKAQFDISNFSYYIPDLTNFDKDNTYIEIYNEKENRFDKEVRASEISNLSTFSRSNLWFDYNKKIWANIKVVKNGIETWWVWIPRYAVSVGGTSSDVIFIDTNNNPIDGSTLPNTYKIAGAFEGNDLKGIWVSKYQPTNKQ